MTRTASTAEFDALDAAAASACREMADAEGDAGA